MLAQTEFPGMDSIWDQIAESWRNMIGADGILDDGLSDQEEDEVAQTGDCAGDDGNCDGGEDGKWKNDLTIMYESYWSLNTNVEPDYFLRELAP